VLALLVWQRPNLLLLDEPTNHLDLTTREALSMALNEFEGTVMLVSHDRALLREVCDEFWLVARGEVSPSTATWTTTSAGYFIDFPVHFQICDSWRQTVVGFIHWCQLSMHLAAKAGFGQHSGQPGSETHPAS
jgi:ABC-type cobalamin/Fe3+-siderophores transport system ATPase subunit